jgi:replicative DNA helicase
MDAVGHGKVVLGAVLAYRRREILDYALARLHPGHFTDRVQAALFAMAERYLDQSGGILTRPATEDALRATAPGETLLYLEYFDLLAALRPGADEFRWSVDQLRELAAERMTGDALTTAMEILRSGRQDGRQELRGHADARTWLLTALSEVEQSLRQAESPEGDVRHEQQEILARYGARKLAAQSGRSSSVGTGIAELDVLLGGGCERGELDLVLGWTSAGKTSFLVQTAWHAALMQGRNVVYFTSETLRAQVITKLLARHSRQPQFGLRDGLNSRDIKSGTLTPAQELVLAGVAADFGQAPGRVYLAQTPKGATITSVSAQLARITRSWTADLVIVDSLQLLRSDLVRRAGWEEVSRMLKDAKEMAATYRDGLGVPVISPWQVSLEGRRNGRQRGYYTTEDPAESREAANSADVILALLEPPDFTGGRNVQLTLSVPKNRDGEARFGQSGLITLDADYATCCFSARSASHGQALLDEPFASGTELGAFG